MRKPAYSMIVVAVPTKKREALVEDGVFVGWTLVSFAAGNESGIEVVFFVGGPEAEGVIVRCFMVAVVLVPAMEYAQ